MTLKEAKRFFKDQQHETQLRIDEDNLNDDSDSELDLPYKKTENDDDPFCHS